VTTIIIVPCLFSFASVANSSFVSNRKACIRHRCRKTTVLSCHRCLLNPGVEKNELHLNIDKNFDHPLSLSKSKC
jgi:hypothetical protein